MELSVLLLNVGPSNFRKVSDMCLKTVRNLSVAKKPVSKLSEMSYLSDFTLLHNTVCTILRKLEGVIIGMVMRRFLSHLHPFRMNCMMLRKTAPLSDSLYFRHPRRGRRRRGRNAPGVVTDCWRHFLRRTGRFFQLARRGVVFRPLET